MYSEEALAWFRSAYRYDPVTGVVSRTDNGAACDTLTSSRRYYFVQPKRAALGIRGLVYVHKLAWFLHTGQWPPQQVDHVNTNGLDNRIDNLRLASPTENIRNRRKPSRKDLTSRYKGVSWQPDKRKWRARIVIDKQSHHLGYFESEKEAWTAYCEAATLFFKEFARLS